MAENSHCDKQKDASENVIEHPSRPSSANKVNSTIHWFAQCGTEPNFEDREDRVRQVRDRQNEERLRKLNEIKQQALHAQKVREQNEEERRRRIEELRIRDLDRRSQVEERKRQYEEAERMRREAILRKNQEREARIETKRRNERCPSAFAFGSSTPRMLEPADTGGSSFWTSRRATSTTNVMFVSAAAPLTRRSSEREVDGSKKRATSAGGLDRDPNNEDLRMSTSMYEVFHWHTPSPFSKSAADDVDASNVQTTNSFSNRVARRRTDLMPTIPSPRDSNSFHQQHSKSFTRSPGRAFSMTRLDQLAQPRRRTKAPQFTLVDIVDEPETVSDQRHPTRHPPRHLAPLKRHNSNNSNSKSSENGAAALNQFSRSMGHLAAKPLRKSDTSTSMSHLNFSRPLVVTPRMNKTDCMRRQRILNASKSETTTPPPSSGGRSGDATPSRPGSALSGTSSVTSSVVVMRRPTSASTGGARRPRPASIAGTSTSEMKHHLEHLKPPLPNPRVKSQNGKIERVSSKSSLAIKNTSSSRSSTRTTPLTSPSTENVSLPGSTCSIQNSDPKSRPNTPKRKKSQTESTQVVTTNGDSKVKAPKSEPTENLLEKKSTEENIDLVKVNDDQNDRVEAVTTETIENKENLVNISSEDRHELVSPTENKLETVDKSINQSLDLSEVSDMSASMIAKNRITTEEEAKAALAERRRLAREEAERQAELERQRREEEARLEYEREKAEEEEQRRLEEETLRLVQEQKAAEEQRLRQAIEEAQRREDEERKRKCEEERQKAEKEEAERKAREEAEKQRIELAVKLEKEEKERELRRKRVEAIMLRTRSRGSTGGTNNGTGNQTAGNQSGNEGGDERPSNTDTNGSNVSDDYPVRNGSIANNSESKEIINNCLNATPKTIDNNTNNVLREVQLQPPDSPLIHRQLDDEFNAVNCDSVTGKVPLNGSNVINIYGQHNITANANELSTASIDLITNEDNINSNKTLSDSQAVAGKDLLTF